MRIENTISLKDEMSPALAKMMKVMNRVIKVMERVAKASNNVYMGSQMIRAKKDMKEIEDILLADANAMRILNKETQKAGRSADSTAKKFRRFAGALRGGYSTSLSNIAHGLYTAERLYNYGKAAFGGIDMMKSQKSLIRLSNDSPRSVNNIYDDVIGIALGTRTSLSATGDTVGRLLSSGALKNRPGGNMANALKYAEMLNKAMVSSGRSAEEIERAMVQLNQGLGQNILQGDELRSIREQVPYFAALLAEGISRKGGQYAGATMADLKPLGAQGVLTTDFILDALDRVSDKINADYELTEKTFGQGITMLQTLWLKFLNSMSDAEKPFDRLTKMVWNLVNYLKSAEGETFFHALEKILNEIVTLIEITAKVAGETIMFIADNIDTILPVLTIIVGTVKTLNAYLAITKLLEQSLLWPIMAIIGVITLVVIWVQKFREAIQETGYTVEDLGIRCQQTLWVIAGAIGTVVSVVISIILTMIELVFGGLSTLGYAVLEGIQSIANKVKDAIVGVINFLIDKINKAIGYLNIVLSLQNAFAGTNYSVGYLPHVGGESTNGFGNFRDFEKESASTKKWNKTKDVIKGIWTDGDYNSSGIAGAPLRYVSEKINNLENKLSNKPDVGTTGNSFNAFHNIEGMYNSLNNIADSTDKLAEPGGTNPSGGSLDSVKDVSLSDEDVKLLREMSARDYLLKLQQITPMVNVTFGDVRETADVGKIMDVIEIMAREQLASSMVTVG